MRKIGATYIFTPENQLLKNGILICEDDGTIIKIELTNDNIKEQAGLEYYSGILVPGFVNTHCHLELSHLKSKIEKNLGLSGFLKQINLLRNNEPNNFESLLQTIDRKMWMAGIAAIGDIANTAVTKNVKKKSKIHYYTFIETFGLHPSRAEKAFKIAMVSQKDFANSGLSNSIVPHSAYSASAPLFRKIVGENKGLISIHNQESNDEDQFIRTGNGPLANHFQNNLNIDISNWKPTGKSPLSKILDYIPQENQLLLIHNTLTQKSDVDELKQRRNKENTFFVLCPNSNLHITNQLPPVELFQKEQLNICIGTDSLASNSNLSVLSELITLQNNFSEIRLEELLCWATINGAKALGIEKHFGSFEPKKKPGINLITGINFRSKKFNSKSKLKRLV